MKISCEYVYWLQKKSFLFYFCASLYSPLQLDCTTLLLYSWRSHKIEMNVTHHTLNCCMIAINDNLIHLGNLYSLSWNVLYNSISSGMYLFLIQKTAILSRQSCEDGATKIVQAWYFIFSWIFKSERSLNINHN